MTGNVSLGAPVAFCLRRLKGPLLGTSLSPPLPGGLSGDRLPLLVGTPCASGCTTTIGGDGTGLSVFFAVGEGMPEGPAWSECLAFELVGLIFRPVDFGDGIDDCRGGFEPFAGILVAPVAGRG